MAASWVPARGVKLAGSAAALWVTVAPAHFGSAAALGEVWIAAARRSNSDDQAVRSRANREIPRNIRNA
jgi:hypothetical protein